MTLEQAFAITCHASTLSKAPKIPNCRFAQQPSEDMLYPSESEVAFAQLTEQGGSPVSSPMQFHDQVTTSPVKRDSPVKNAEMYQSSAQNRGAMVLQLTWQVAKN